MYERSIAIKEKAVGPDHPDVANTRSSLGYIYFVKCDYAKAESLYLSSLAPLAEAARHARLRPPRDPRRRGARRVRRLPPARPEGVERPLDARRVRVFTTYS